MQAKVITEDSNGNKHIAADSYDLDDALSSAKIMLKLGKASAVFIQTIGGKFQYKVTKSGMNYNIKGSIQPSL